MGFVIPFKNNLKSENPLVNIANDYMEKGYTPVDLSPPVLMSSPTGIPAPPRTALV